MKKIKSSLVMASIVALACGTNVAFAASPIVSMVHAGGPDSSFYCNGCDANFSLNGRIYADGTVEGQFQDTFKTSATDPSGGGFSGAIHGVITCLVVDGNKAWIGGIITHGIDDTPSFAAYKTGNQFLAEVMDNGRNNVSPYDKISFTFGGATVANLCNNKPSLSLRDMPDGQVSIK